MKEPPLPKFGVGAQPVKRGRMCWRGVEGAIGRGEMAICVQRDSFVE